MSGTTDPSGPIPAATVIVFRDRVEGPPELLMVERSPRLAFAPGALVFPGGRIDPGDHDLARQFHPADREAADEAAARIAAIRETIEEAGIAPGLIGAADGALLARWRDALAAGHAFGDLLTAAGATLDLDALVPFARWLPDRKVSRVFDTRFYLARLPTGAPAASVDRTENVALVWTTAADALRGPARVIFPTRRNLERLAPLASFDAAVADAAAHPVRTITPWIEQRDGVAHLCIPEGLGYPVSAVPADTVERG